MKVRWLAGVVVFAATTGLAFAQMDKGKSEAKGKGAKSVTVKMGAQNKSGESGTAKLTAQGDQTKVDITLKGAPKGVAQPAHIHEGTCAQLDPKPKQGLANVVDGKSSTVVPMSLSSLTSGKLAINVHKSTDDLKTYVSCGDIKAGGAAKKKSS